MSGVKKGTPSAVFLPARSYNIKESGELVALTVPVRGTFPSDPDIPFSGDFDLSPERGTFLFGDLLKVMFAMRAYPELEDNQRFSIYAVEVEADKVSIVGRVIEFVED